jgi:glutaredoxin
MLTVYGKPNCPQCEQAKNLLESREIEYKYTDISQNEEHRDFIVGMGLRSLPQIFEGDNHIGDVSDLEFYMDF